MTREQARVAVISGTGVTEHFDLSGARSVKTPYGVAEAFEARDGGFYVLPRHGKDHAVPPHRVNYRANVAALKSLGVGSILATSAVGSMNEEFRVGQLGVVEQFLDFTKGRQGTFFDDEVSHVDVTEPYSSRVNGLMGEAAKRLGVALTTGLTYVCAEGPRFETAAEIRMFRAMGGDVVGMTGVPEVVLARELEMEYSSVAVATNWAAGIQKKVSHDEVLTVMKEAGAKVSGLLRETINLL
jgi:5'-methylthioinosine phosphorylase